MWIKNCLKFKMEDTNLYIEIEEPNFIRKNLLKGAAESLFLLKDLEEDASNFEKEEELFKRFKNQMVHVRTEVYKFEKKLPKVEEKKTEPKVEVKKEKKKKKPKKKKPKSETDIIKEQINDIEKKLKEL